MARNRVIYQSELLFVSNDASATGAQDHEELKRVQSANYGFTVSRQDVNEYGQLASIDRIVLDPPVVNVDFSYYLTDGFNEQALGFWVQSTGDATEAGFASGHLQAGSGRNLFITVHKEGVDAATTDGGTPNPDAVIGIGNAYLSDYTVDLSVGSLPTVSVTMEAANINSDTVITDAVDSITDIASPAVDTADGTPSAEVVALPYSGTLYADERASKISALRPGDVTVTITNAQNQVLANIDATTAGSHVQSASISVPLSRSNLTKLGTKFDYAKVIDFPVTASLSVSAICNELTARNLTSIVDEAGVEVTVSVADPNGGDTAAKYTLKNVKVDSESFSSSIGADKSVDMTFTTQIGSATDATNGVFMSGKWGNGVFA